MSRFRPRPAHRFACASRLALALAAGLAVAGHATSLPAQTMPELRGSVTDPMPTGAVERYVPVSPGAVPDTRPGEMRSADPAFEGSASPPAAARRPAAIQEEPASTGTVRMGTVDALDEERSRAVRPDAERALPIEAVPRAADQDPFAAPGIRMGGFVLRPSLQQGVEWTSNATHTAGGSSDVLSETTLRLDARSEWERHSASLDAFGTYRKSIRGTGFEEFLGGADAAVGVDLGHEFRLEGRLGYHRRPEEATSAVELPALAGRPLRQTLSGSLALQKALGHLRFALTGAVDRNTYGDAPLAGGGTLSQAERNQTLYLLRLRAGYQVSPALQPFVEAEVGRRVHDLAVDASGYRRSAVRTGARAGLAADFGEKLSGEIAAGWIGETLEDPRLGRISALSAEGNLAWSPMRGTLVSLTGTTEIEGTTTAASAGSVLYSSRLGVTRDLRSNLSGNAAIGAAWRNYVGSGETDLTLSGEVGLTWWMNRYAGLAARARHERLQSSISGRSSSTNSVFMGLTLRR